MHIGLQILPLFLLCISFVPVYADIAIPEIDVGDAVDNGFDYFGSFSKSAIDNTDVDPKIKNGIGDAIETGIPVAKKGFDFWTSLHHFLVGLIFNNSPIPIDVGIVSIISMALVGFAMWHFLKKVIKWMIYIALGIIAVFIALIVFGISIPI